jgi:photosystem II stability/assembly factor-like uncharacterized protein
MRPIYLFCLAAFLCSLQAVECQQFTWLDRVQTAPLADIRGGQQIVRNPTTGSLFCVGWLNGTVMRSTDNGRTWRGTYTWLTSVTRKNAWLIALPNGTIVYMGMTTYNVRIASTSTDDGLTWGRLVRDPAMVFNDTAGSFVNFVPPNTLYIQGNTEAERCFVSLDGGQTWKTTVKRPADASIPLHEEISPAPNTSAVRRKPTWIRMNFASDTAWSASAVPYACRNWVELSNGIVFGIMNYACVWRDTRSADTTWNEVRSVRDNVRDTSYDVKPYDLLRANDSVAYLTDSKGFIYKFSSTSRTLTLHHRIQHSDDEEFYAKALPPRQDSTMFVRYKSVLNKDGSRTESEVWLTIANTSGVVREHRTTGWRTSAESLPTSISHPEGPLSFINDSLVFCIGEWPNRRDYARTTNLGATWMYIDDMTILDLDTVYQSILSSSVLPSGQRVMQTDGDILLKRTPEGLQSITQYTTSWGYDIQRMTLFVGKASVPVQKRMPQIVVDNGSTIVSRDYLLRIDPSTGATIDTVLPRRALFMHRFNSEMLAAGADSLWISFDNMKEWVYVPAVPDAAPGLQRPTISDVSRAGDGTLYCALRGYYRRNTQGEESVYAAGGVSISTDDGNTWSMSTGWPERLDHVTTIATLRNGDILACAQDVVFDSLKNVGETTRFKGNEMLYAAILRSTDRGQTWNIVYTDYAAGIVYPTFDLALVELPDGRVIATTFNGNVLESRTNGRTWNTYDIPELGTALVNTMNIESDHSLIFNTTTGVGRFIIPATSVAEDRTPSAVTARITPSGTLLVNACTDIDHVTLSTVDGRVMLEATTATSSRTTDVSSLPTGVYIVTVTWQGGVVARTLVMRP